MRRFHVKYHHLRVKRLTMVDLGNKSLHLNIVWPDCWLQNVLIFYSIIWFRRIAYSIILSIFDHLSYLRQILSSLDIFWYYLLWSSKLKNYLIELQLCLSINFTIFDHIENRCKHMYIHDLPHINGKPDNVKHIIKGSP